MDKCFSAPATTTTTSSINLDHHGNNNQNQDMGCPSSSSSSSSSSYTHHHQPHQSFLPLLPQHQTHESNFYPSYVFSSSSGGSYPTTTPPIFPVYPLGFEQIGPDNVLLPSSSMGGFFDGVLPDNNNPYFRQEQPLLFSNVQVQKQLDSWITKAARSKRRIARQMSSSSSSSKFAGFNNRLSSSLSCSSSSGSSSCKKTAAALLGDSTLNITDNKEIYTFITPDNKKLKTLLQKELKNSDVTNLGRVVLPKKEAEANLPKLTVKEGIQLPLREVVSTKVWHMRFRFWPNNKSRMYVLENTGEYVKTHNLKVGDSIILYQDEGNVLYIASKRAEEPTPGCLIKEQIEEKSVAPRKDETKEKEVIPPREELKQFRRVEEDTIQLSLRLGGSSSVARNSSNDIPADATPNQPAAVAVEPSSVKDKGSFIVDYDDDCFSELGMLPNFNDKDFSLYENLMKDRDDHRRDSNKFFFK